MPPRASPPASCVWWRVVRDTIPPHPLWADQPGAQNQSTSRRTRNNDYASQKRRARWSSVQVGDAVLVKDRHPGSKFQLPFEADKWTVTAVKETMITATKDGEKVTRNVSHFKRLLAVPVARHEEDGSTDICPVNDSEGASSKSATPHLPEPSVRDRAVSGRPARTPHLPVAANEVLLHAGSSSRGGHTNDRFGKVQDREIPPEVSPETISTLC
ncbi:hypothetical protein NDU88_001023 [Pleurodeles waltl]|uniref:Uncharacterized protein n=1 Tax=Pleurodeles waltl TaxID=8319 RepID=A0AAV7P5K6_PLEWA|nr:hypothetical protein NDU88_001023 [Pleurodeles waltl]